MKSIEKWLGILIGGTLGMLVLAAIPAAIYGYINNIITLFGYSGVDAELFVRLVGVFFAPIGIIAGYL